jgi:hypothetical protein
MDGHLGDRRLHQDLGDLLSDRGVGSADELGPRSFGTRQPIKALTFKTVTGKANKQRVPLMGLFFQYFARGTSPRLGRDHLPRTEISSTSKIRVELPGIGPTPAAP